MKNYAEMRYDRLVLIIDGRPGYEQSVRTRKWKNVLGGNARSHPMARHRVKTRDTEAVAMLTKTLMPRCPMFKRPAVVFKLHMTGNPRRDYDNQVGLIKGALDGLKAGGIIEDDAMEIIGKPWIDVEADTDNYYVITVEERDA